jgi:2-acylglycerol O-acyltransferase 2
MFDFVKTPIVRRIQTASVLVWFWIIFPLGAYVLVGILISLMALFCLPVLLAYLFWMLAVDADTASKRGRVWRAFQRCIVWKRFAEYFPIRLYRQSPGVPLRSTSNSSSTKDSEEKSGQFIFCCHPHGVISISAVNFVLAPHQRHRDSALDGSVAGESDESELDRRGRSALLDELADIDTRLLTLSMNFKVPFFRDALMALGAGAVTEQSIRYKLRSGMSVAIVVGGAAESLDAHAGTNDLTLRRRRGFVRLALATGSDLVPVLSLGENDLFTQLANPANSRIRTFQERVKSLLGFAPAIAFGRAVFNRMSFGLLPYRRPVRTIVGDPVRMPFIAQPSKDDIDEHHERYTDALLALYTQFADRFDADRIRPLRIVA